MQFWGHKHSDHCIKESSVTGSGNHTVLTSHFLMMVEAATSHQACSELWPWESCPEAQPGICLFCSYKDSVGWLSLLINNFLLKLAAQVLLAATKHPGQGNKKTQYCFYSSFLKGYLKREELQT